MYRTPTHKLVYYIGQPSDLGQPGGELYDLQGDPNELDNLWDNPAAGGIKTDLLGSLLEWLAASNYWNSGYKRKEGASYQLRWPVGGDYGLHGGGQNTHPKPLEYL
jgi:hypothetical protein